MSSFESIQAMRVASALERIAKAFERMADAAERSAPSPERPKRSGYPRMPGSGGDK